MCRLLLVLLLAVVPTASRHSLAAPAADCYYVEATIPPYTPDVRVCPPPPWS